MSAGCTTCHGSYRVLIRHLREVSELTGAQWLMLRSAADHNDPRWHLSGRSAHGGATRTLFKLTRLGLLDKDENITEAGRAALAGRKKP